MSVGHSHAGSRAAERHRRPLLVAFVLVLVFMVVEIVAGFATGSLSLLSDAGHMATDALGLGMALAAISVATRSQTSGHRTYGLYRLEILAALANAVLLFGIAVFVIIEAIRRLQNPTDVLSGWMLIVAVVGLIVNVVAWRLLRIGAKESLNVEGANLEVLADLVGSIGVITAALIIQFTGWPYADPLFAAAIGLFILPRAWTLGRKALRVLVEAAPEGLDVDELYARLADISGVVDVHDLHVWTLTSEMDVATVHIMTSEGADSHRVLDRARDILETEYGIPHATLQVEPDTHTGCTEVTW